MSFLRYSKFKHIALATFIIMSSSAIFIYGIGVGRYAWFPFQLLSDLNKEILFENKIEVENEIEFEGNDDLLLRFAFEQPILKSELLYDPINSLAELNEKNKSLLFSYNDFFNAYDKLKITSDELIFLDDGKTVVKKLDYDLHGKSNKAYSYKITGAENNNIAVLIIPGSGSNQSSEIYSNNPDNYHYGLTDLLKKRGYDIYIYIKPNHDILAWHNQNQKVTESFFVNWHLNHGSSYSASYLTESLAFSKFLKYKYENFIVAGLSQGGFATLLNSLQSQPTLSIISSGYSVNFDSYEWAGHNQIIIPGLFNSYSSDKVFSMIDNQDSDYFLSYGLEEIGTYRIEAEDRTTCMHFNPLANVTCVIHDHGHVFPQNEIEIFLNKNL